jgi:hypothetical protein
MSFVLKSVKIVVTSHEQAQLEKMQVAMGILDSFVPPDMNFVKHVTMVLKLVEARVSGGRTTYLLLFTENNHHLKDYLERVYELPGLHEFFPVPCKFFTRKVSTHNHGNFWTLLGENEG